MIVINKLVNYECENLQRNITALLTEVTQIEKNNRHSRVFLAGIY